MISVVCFVLLIQSVMGDEEYPDSTSRGNESILPVIQKYTSSYISDTCLRKLADETWISATTEEIEEERVQQMYERFYSSEIRGIYRPEVEEGIDYGYEGEEGAVDSDPVDDDEGIECDWVFVETEDCHEVDEDWEWEMINADDCKYET